MDVLTFFNMYSTSKHTHLRELLAIKGLHKRSHGMLIRGQGILEQLLSPVRKLHKAENLIYINP